MVGALPESLKPLYFVEREKSFMKKTVALVMIPAYKYLWISIKFVKLFLL